MRKKNDYDAALYKTSKLFSILSIVFIVAFSGFIFANQAWGLQTQEVLRTQWFALGTAAFLFSVLVILSFRHKQTYAYYVSLLLAQSIIYIIFISLVVYYQRGMASNAIVLYCVPIIAISVSRTAVAIFAVSTASTIGYILAIFKYFQNYPSEGYKIELYGQMIFYSFILMLIAFATKIVLDYLDRK